MSIISKWSINYLIISGEHFGKVCVPRESGDEKDGFITVILDEDNNNKSIVVEKGVLSSLDKPGQLETMPVYPHDLEDHFRKHSGGGDNMLRTDYYTQPRCLQGGDALATGETVVESPRRGYNNSTLIHLDRTGWIELAARLPIAFQGNMKYKLPFNLVKGDKLVTGCLVSENSVSNEVDWVQIFLDHHIVDGIETPSCIPLAIV